MVFETWKIADVRSQIRVSIKIFPTKESTRESLNITLLGTQKGHGHYIYALIKYHLYREGYTNSGMAVQRWVGVHSTQP